MVITSLGYKRAFRSFGNFPNPSSTVQKIRMIISSVVMSDLQYGFSTYIVGFSHDDFNLHHWLYSMGCRWQPFSYLSEYTPLTHAYIGYCIMRLISRLPSGIDI